jgi:hypothetical protein
MTGLVLGFIIAFVGGGYILYKILEDNKREGP